MEAVSSGRLNRGFSPARRFAVDLPDVLRDVRPRRTLQDVREQAYAAEVLANRVLRDVRRRELVGMSGRAMWYRKL